VAARARPIQGGGVNYLKLTAAQATVRFLVNQLVADGERETQYFAGVWAIFGHGNVAGFSDALYEVRARLPTYRAHNEQGMAHAAIAFAKQMRRRRAMICTTSIGPGATNLVTAAALAHVNRLPVLLLPGDVYASRRPDPVLQQIEDFSDGTVSANDCLRPVSRYFDRITRAEQLLDALPRAMATLLDPAACGPVTLALCQDVQTEAGLFPETFFAPRVWSIRAPRPDPHELERLAESLRSARSPLIIAGGGVAYSGASAALAEFAARSGIPVAETQAGKGSLAWDHPMNLGALGVTGTSPANLAAARADLIVGLGTRLADFTTGSRALFAAPGRRLVQVNICAPDAAKHGAQSVVADVGATISELEPKLAGWRTAADWTRAATANLATWNGVWEQATAPDNTSLPSDAQVLGAIWRQAAANAVVVCAAGGLPGELHKLWRTRTPGGYHVEYGFSCMGYEIAGGVGVKMAAPEREVHVVVGDGSYLMMNSELATAVMLDQKLIVTVLDNHGFGCIHRLQKSVGSEPFNNLLGDSGAARIPNIDIAAHAASLGVSACKVRTIAELETALTAARRADLTCVIVIETDPERTTSQGGAWWDVAVPAVSERESVRRARAEYETRLGAKRED
jgi:3D-(3,5/4)-trihydroxycyclohexane-1,2-dione acylhydrolase (decyclizing)